MKRNIRVTQLAPIGFGVIIFLIAGTNLITNWRTNVLLSSINWVTHTYKVKEELAELEKTLVDAETGQRGFIFTGKEEFLEPYSDSREKLEDIFLDLSREVSDNPDQLKRVSQVESLSQQKLEELAATISLKKAGKEKLLRELVVSGKGKQIMDNIRIQIAEIRQIEEQLLSERKKVADQAHQTLVYIGWGSLFVITGISLVTSTLIANTIARSIGKVVKIAEQVSAGNLTEKIENPANSDDEIGKLLNAFQNMTGNLNALIQQVQQSGILVNISATKLAAFGKQVEGTATEQAASTTEVVTAAKEIATTSEALVKTMENVAVLSQTAMTNASSGQQDLVQMERTMRKLVEATTSISNKLEALSNQANSINSIVATITKVANQTNLLSLNAAIEAEKAGEYGLGFAVVSREIRRLADQTAVATLDIEQMVREMQSAVSTGVMEMDKFSKEVEDSINDVANIIDKLTHVNQQVQDLNPRFEVVNQGMEAQSQGAQQISQAMVQLSDTSVQTVDSLQEINSAIEQLNQAAQGLGREISRFKVNAEDFSQSRWSQSYPQNLSWQGS